MPSGNILSKTDLDYWRQQLEEARHACPEKKRQIVAAYYNYLTQNNHAYGAFAVQVVGNTGFIGRLANAYTQHVVKQDGIEWTEKKWHAVMVKLARTDLEYRAGNFGQVLMPKAISKYHGEVFESQELPQKAWLGTIFEKHGDTGVWMLGQVPEDQHGQPFTLAGINRLIDQASQSGTEAHRDFAQFISICLTDKICFNVLSENLGGFIGFLGRTVNGLDDCPIHLDWHNLLKLYDQFNVRHQVNGCLTALQANDGVTDKTSGYTCTRAAANASAFAKECGLEAAKIEIQLEYERSRFRYPMPSELQALVDVEFPNTITGALSNQMNCHTPNPNSLSRLDSPLSLRAFEQGPSHGLLNMALFSPSSNTTLNVFTPPTFNGLQTDGGMTPQLTVSRLSECETGYRMTTCDTDTSGSALTRIPEHLGIPPINKSRIVGNLTGTSDSQIVQSSTPSEVATRLHNPAEPDRPPAVQFQPWANGRGEVGISVAIPCVIS